MYVRVHLVFGASFAGGDKGAIAPPKESNFIIQTTGKTNERTHRQTEYNHITERFAIKHTTQTKNVCVYSIFSAASVPSQRTSPEQETQLLLGWPTVLPQS